MRHRSKWRKRSDDSTIGINNTSSLVNTTSSTHPSTTFTIHNNNNVLSNLITNTSRLLHSKSTYFYNGWGRVIPTFCILSLLVGLYSFVNPTIDLDNDANKAYAEGAADIAPYAITPTLSLTIGGAGADETVNAYTGTVAYRAHSVNVVASNIKSYSLMLTGPAKLINGTTELTGAGGRIPDGTGDSAMLDNTWGYYYGTDSNQVNVAYNSLTGSAQTLDSSTMHTSSSDNASTGAVVNGSTNFTKNLVFAAKFGNTATAGHYTGNVTLSLVAEAKTVVEYSITYNKNTTDTTVTNMPTPNPQQISDESGGSSITTTLSSTIPTRTGYTFKGWSTSNTATTAQYQPNSTITLQEANKDITLYAVWEEKPVIFNGITTMQQMTADICKNAKENDSAQLTDTRDNKKYWVTKLKDGNCWMTQNLAYNGGGTSRGTNCSGWQDTNTVAQYCSPGHTDGDHASRGNYYSWAAAMNNNTSATGQVQGICPDGWHLPTSNTTAKGSFGGLAAYGVANNSTGSAIMRGAPMHFQYSGYAYSGGIDIVGTHGRYWSSTPNGSYNAYALYLNSTTADPSNSNGRYLGCSVRCLMKTNSDDFWEPDSLLLD